VPSLISRNSQKPENVFSSSSEKPFNMTLFFITAKSFELTIMKNLSLIQQQADGVNAGSITQIKRSMMKWLITM
jgi:hypothetical protein